MGVFLIKCFRASGEAILGTQRFLEQCVFFIKFVRASCEAILGTQRYLEQCVFLIKLFRASGEAILGTQRYLEHFTKALYTRTLSKHFIKVLQRHYKGITNIFVQLTHRGEVLPSITCWPGFGGEKKP